MAKGNIGFRFSINNFPVRSIFDTRINVREDFNFLRYGSSFGPKNVGISYINAKKINVYDNLMIKDKTDIIPENSPFTYTEEIKLNQTFSLHNAKFLISDVFKTNSFGEEFPLYYYHDLSRYDNISDIKILDANFNDVNLDLYLFLDESATLGYERKGIYTNLYSEYISKDNVYTVYYVKFKDLNTNTFITELLNPKEFYSQATFATAETDRVYSVTAENGAANIVVFFNSMAYSPTPIPNSQRFAIKMYGDKRIKIERPADLPPSEKWYLKINPGEFYRNTAYGSIRYYVPEYDTQLFSPVRPYRLLIEKKAKVINSRLLYVEPKPIANLNIPGFYLYIISKNKYGKTIRALTNDPEADVYKTPDGIVTEIFYEYDTIESVSDDNGFIRLKTDIEIDSEVSITYRYEEYSYPYRGISVNSTINPEILNNKIIIYCVPEIFSRSSKSIYHLLADEKGLIIKANETSNYEAYTGVAIGGSKLSLIDLNLADEDIYTGYEIEFLSGINSGRKLKITGYIPSQKKLSFDVELLVNVANKDSYRINKYTEDHDHYDPISGVTFSYDGWITTYTDFPYYNIILGDVFAVQTVSPSDIQKSDIRIRGGGIREDEIDNALKMQDETQWNWDIGYWDGQPYPGMGAMLIELPREILKEVGGNFSRKQVREIVEKHIGHGVHPIIKYYDRSTSIISIAPKDKRIDVEWQDIKASSYKIYVGQNPDQMHEYRVVAGITTSITIDNLENNKVYYIMIEAYYGGVPQLPSRKAFAIPFDATAIKPIAVYGDTLYGEGTYSHA